MLSACLGNAQRGIRVFAAYKLSGPAFGSWRFARERGTPDHQLSCTSNIFQTGLIWGVWDTSIDLGLKHLVQPRHDLGSMTINEIWASLFGFCKRNPTNGLCKGLEIMDRMKREAP